MKDTLAKPWGKHPPGTIITTEALEGAVLVNNRRFEALRTGGFFAKPAPPPEEKPKTPATPPAATGKEGA